MSKPPLKFVDVKHQLSFGSGVFPRVVVANDDIPDMTSCVNWLRQHQNAVEAELANSGAILFRGFPLHSAEDFDAFSAAFGYPNFTYQESFSNAVRVNYTDRVFTANEAPKDVEIFLHHELAQTPVSPKTLFFYCQSAAEAGGETPLCRSDELFAELQQQAPGLAQDFAEKGVKYTNTMPAENDPESGQGRSWRSTLSVETVPQAEHKLADLGYSWTWLDDGSLRATTPVLPAVLQREDGRQVFYNQLIAAYMGWQGVFEEPSRAITFGDGTAIPKQGLDLVVKLSEQFTFDLPWQAGDVAIVDNRLTMHGRRAYSGDRKRIVLAAFAGA